MAHISSKWPIVSFHAITTKRKLKDWYIKYRSFLIKISQLFFILFLKIKYYNNVRKVRKVRIMKEQYEDDRFIVSVKVGPKGQITIPVEARKMFDIKEGESLLVLGDKKRGGIAIMKADLFYAMMDKEDNK